MCMSIYLSIDRKDNQMCSNGIIIVLKDLMLLSVCGMHILFECLKALCNDCVKLGFLILKYRMLNL